MDDFGCECGMGGLPVVKVGLVAGVLAAAGVAYFLLRKPVDAAGVPQPSLLTQGMYRLGVK